MEFSNYNSILAIDSGTLNDLAEKYGKKFAQEDKINTNQLRNIYSEIEKMRTRFEAVIRKKDDANTAYNEIRKNLIMLKPKLAYAAARTKSMESFKVVFDQLIKLAENDKKNDAIKVFFDFSEAIVAYHKYYETKK